jgi:hypothetical protein
MVAAEPVLEYATAAAVIGDGPPAESEKDWAEVVRPVMELIVEVLHAAVTAHERRMAALTGLAIDGADLDAIGRAVKESAEEIGRAYANFDSRMRAVELRGVRVPLRDEVERASLETLAYFKRVVDAWPWIDAGPWQEPDAAELDRALNECKSGAGVDIEDILRDLRQP